MREQAFSLILSSKDFRHHDEVKQAIHRTTQFSCKLGENIKLNPKYQWQVGLSGLTLTKNIDNVHYPFGIDCEEGVLFGIIHNPNQKWCPSTTGESSFTCYGRRQYYVRITLDNILHFKSGHDFVKYVTSHPNFIKTRWIEKYVKTRHRRRWVGATRRFAIETQRLNRRRIKYVDLNTIIKFEYDEVFDKFRVKIVPNTQKAKTGLVASPVPSAVSPSLLNSPLSIFGSMLGFTDDTPTILPVWNPSSGEAKFHYFPSNAFLMRNIYLINVRTDICQSARGSVRASNILMTVPLTAWMNEKSQKTLHVLHKEIKRPVYVNCIQSTLSEITFSLQTLAGDVLITNGHQDTVITLHFRKSGLRKEVARVQR